MKHLKLFGLAFGASLALSTAAVRAGPHRRGGGSDDRQQIRVGRQMKNGAEQAVEDLNAAGGVLAQAGAAGR